MDELLRRPADVLVRCGFAVLPGRVFAGLRLIVRRTLTEPSPKRDGRILTHHGLPCALQQISWPAWQRWVNSVGPGVLAYVRSYPDGDRNSDLLHGG
jgi:hypothetical protein